MRNHVALGLVALLLVGCEEEAQGPQVPDAPGSISANVAGGTIEITWDEVPGATTYRIYMAAVAGVKQANYAALAENMFHPDLVGKFDHPAGLNDGQTYHFVVTAVNAEGESVESCEVTARINPPSGGTC